MQDDITLGDLIISTCPKCGTRLMSAKIIINGMMQCAKCKRHWLVEVDDEKVLIRRPMHGSKA